MDGNEIPGVEYIQRAPSEDISMAIFFRDAKNTVIEWKQDINVLDCCSQAESRVHNNRSRMR